MDEEPGPPTFRSIVNRTFQVWGRRFAPLSAITVALVYANQYFASVLDAVYLAQTMDPLAGWALRFFGGWAFNIASGAVAAVLLIRIAMSAMGHETAGREGHSGAVVRHALAVGVIYMILSPGEIVADLFPPQPYLAIGIVWSLPIALFICADITRVAEGAGVRDALARSYRLLRPRLLLVLVLTMLWEAAGWIPFLALNPLFLDQGVLNNEAGAKWLVGPLTRSAAYLFGMLGSIVLFADLRTVSQDETVRVFD